MVLCPCSCINKLMERGKKRHDLPVTKHYGTFPALFPDCLKSKKVYDGLLNRSLNENIPNFDVKIPDFRKQSTGKTDLTITNADGGLIDADEQPKLLKPAPKYKNTLNGRRIRSTNVFER